jgi:hypothetical protein
MLAQLAQWDPEFGMVEIENLNFMENTNRAQGKQHKKNS